MSGYLRFRSIQIARAPGIEPGFSVAGMTPGLNLIVGPNGVGKSTVARAIQRFLWADRTDVSAIDYTAEIEQDGAVTIGEVHRTNVTWSGFAPACGEASRADRYHLRIDRLLQDSERAGDLHGIVMRELRGGVDIRQLREQFKAKRLPSPNLPSLETELRNARDQARSADVQRELTLPVELKRLEEANAAFGRQNRLDELQDILRMKIELDHQQASLDEVPEAVRHMEEISMATLDQIEKEVAAADFEWDRAASAAKHHAQPGFPAPSVDGERDRALAKWRDELVGVESDLRTLRSQAANAEVRRARAAEQLSDIGVPHDRLASLDRIGWQKLEDALRKWLAAEARLQGILGLETILPEATELGNRAQLDRRLAQLAAWLETPDTDLPTVTPSRTPVGAVWALVVSGAIISLAGAGLGGPVRWILVIVGVALLVGAVVLALQVKDSVTFEKPVKPTLEGTGDGHRQGVLDELANTMRQLQEMEAAKAIFERGQQWWKSRRPEMESLEQDVAAARREFQAVGESLGITTQESNAWIIELVRAAQEVRDSETALEQVRGQILAGEATAQGLRDRINERTAAFGFAPADNVVELQERCGRLAVWAQAEAEAQATADRRQRIHDRRTAFFRSVGLEAGDRLGLEELVRTHQAYRALRSDVEDLSRRFERRSQVCPRWDEELASFDWSLERLEAELASVRSLAEQRQSIQDGVNAIQVEIGQAEKNLAVEEAFGKLTTAQEDHERAKEKHADQLLAATVVEWLEDTLRQDLEPESLRKAGELFTQATGRYGITATSDGFAAVDLESGLSIALSQLSQGTRLQLLVCVRLGFIYSDETSDRPPLLLDETLANSDPLRAESLAKVVLGLAQEGRQVFYFTSQPSESALWQTVASEMGVPFAVHDLAAIRGKSPWSADVREIVPERWEISLPDPSLPWDEYSRRLPLPVLDPWWAPGQVPISLLARPEEQALMHRALEMGADRWGSGQRVVRILDEGWCEQLSARASVLGAALRAWQVGALPTPLTVEQIAACSSFKADAMQIVDALGEYLHEPQKLVDQLRNGANGLKKRRQPTLDGLVTHLQDIERWPEERRLDAQEVRLIATEEAARVGLSGDELHRLLRLLFPEEPAPAFQRGLFQEL